MKTGTKMLIKAIATPLLALTIIAAAAFMLFQFSSLKTSENSEPEDASDKKYNILVVGKNPNAAYLNQIFLGVEQEAKWHDAAATLRTSLLESQETSMQSFFNYASLLEVDGIIAYIEKEEENLSIPKTLDGKPIPLITTGTYLPELRQLSYIGINYSELGRITAEEIIALAGDDKKAVMINSNLSDDLNFSTTMNSLLNTLEAESGITLKNIHFSQNTNFSKEDFFRQQIASEEDIKLLVCLTEEDTNLAVQSALDLNIAGTIRILGFGESTDCFSYYEKNILTELITVKSREIGAKAVAELFEYLNNGYANSYATAEIRVLKKGGTL